MGARPSSPPVAATPASSGHSEGIAPAALHVSGFHRQTAACLGPSRRYGLIEDQLHIPREAPRGSDIGGWVVAHELRTNLAGKSSSLSVLHRCWMGRVNLWRWSFVSLLKWTPRHVMPSLRRFRTTSVTTRGGVIAQPQF